MTSQITTLTNVYSTGYSGADQKRKHQSSTSLAFVQGIHRRPVNSPHKWPVTQSCFHLMTSSWRCQLNSLGIPILSIKMRQSDDCVILIMGILVPGKTVFFMLNREWITLNWGLRYGVCCVVVGRSYHRRLGRISVNSCQQSWMNATCTLVGTHISFFS